MAAGHSGGGLRTASNHPALAVASAVPGSPGSYRRSDALRFCLALQTSSQRFKYIVSFSPTFKFSLSDRLFQSLIELIGIL